MDIRAKAFLQCCSLVLGAIWLLMPAHSAAKEKPAPRVELLLQGPETFGAVTPFRATIINRSNVPVTLVPPKRDWPDEYSMIWSVSDLGGKELRHDPKMFVWCDGLAIHARTISEPGVFLSGKKRAIQENDLVTLQPGQKLELCALGDPVQFFPITQSGEYKVTLSYMFDPSHYVLAGKNGSGHKADALRNAVALDLASNTLTVKLEPLVQNL